MKLFIRRIIAIFAIPYLIACEEVPDFQEEDTQAVVEAFLYEAKPVEDIKITEVLPFASAIENNEVDGLEINILWKGITYPLENTGDGKYHYAGDALQIISGETYEISFQFEGKWISASTSIPAPPQDLHLSSASLHLPQVVDLFDVRDLAQSGNNNVNVAWNNPNGDYYFMVIENMESNPEPIDLNNILDFNFEYTSTPTQNDFFTLIPFVHYTQFGTHRIILYRVNDEYALLYETIEQDSRDLNEPYTNIKNGVGIFSGFASDTVYLEIQKQ